MKRFRYLTLAALVAVAACDEGVDPVVAPPITGTIAGVVTIEAVAAVGVTVTLSSGPTATTDGTGAFQFNDVPVGSYTLTITGYASDATFTTTLKAAVISTTGQVVTANFDGSYVRTSAIIGSVSVGDSPLLGVSVAIGGMSTAATATDTNGQFSFSGLRAGSYTVEMTNPNTASYDFGTTSASVTLATGASEVVTFEGSLVTTASISGSLFIDEFSKDSILNTGLESNVTIAGVSIRLEGILVLDTMTKVTDANGSFSFTDLAEGSYHITIGSTANVPGMLAFSGMTQLTRTVGVGAHETADFPFSIITQTINVGAFLGSDLDDSAKPGPRIAPIKGWSLRLFDTQIHAAAFVASGATKGSLTTKAVKTDAAGNAAFRFARSKDISPDSSTTDHLVFAASRGAPTATYTVGTETILEIQYEGTDSVSTSVDEFDALYNALTIAFNGEEIDGDPLKGWDFLIQANKDTTKAIAMTRSLDSKGWGYADLTLANLTPSAGGALPYTLTLRLTKTQANANGHGFKQVPTGQEGTTQKGRIKFIWDGTRLPGDTIWIGTEVVTYTDVDVLVGIHQEKDDSTDVATYTKGDATGSVAGAALIEMYKTVKGKWVSQGAAAAPGSGGGKVNELVYANLKVKDSWQVRARARPKVGLDVLNDTLVTFTLTGDDQVDTVGVLSGGGGASAFAMKANNTTIMGTILSVDGVTPVTKATVTIVATSDNIQPNKRGTDSTVVKTHKTTGVFTFTGLREGPYTISVADDATWSYMVTLADTAQKVNCKAVSAVCPVIKTVPAAGTGKEKNTDANTATRDVQGYLSTSVVNFAPHYMTTKIQGVVVNDRDDLNALDPGEAVQGVTITLYDDKDNDGKVDSGEELATTTTDAKGAYGFSGLKEDNYLVTAASAASVTVLRAFNSAGTPQAAVDVLTTAAKGAGATLNQNGTRQVGNMDPSDVAQNDEFPRWDYALNTAAADGGGVGGGGPNFANGALTLSPAHFLALNQNGTLSGKIIDAKAKVKANVQIQIQRCATAVGYPVNPAVVPIVGTCSTTWLDTKFILQTDSDASGNYSFSGLSEGVWQVTTSGVETTPAGGSWLIRVKGDLDQVVANFIIT